jgi:hypothetical protein
VANYDSDNVSVLLGNGDGTFQSAQNYGTDFGPSSVAIGDLNGDGYPDLAVTNALRDNVSVLINSALANIGPATFAANDGGGGGGGSDW